MRGDAVQPVRMSDLEYGDLVLSRDRTSGRLVFRPIYLFGHRRPEGRTPYVHISAAAGGYSLAATRGHFMPVCVGRCSDEELAAGAAVLENSNVTPGGSDSLALSLATVTHVDLASARGAFNPYVRGADLLVDGVLASPHSEWLLDWLAPAGLVPYLPCIYEALLAPVYGLYGMVGPTVAEWLAHSGLHLADVGTASEYGIGYFAVLAGMLVPLAAAVTTLRRSPICGWRP
ncbi:hypothetical protein GPECTOR_16g551 [Gonium pectorale]|uniref:Hedgehog protein Hint domain-containing protein n=1 Tax=Gonium pectorale TaxID=33097 RepID=A0A150GKS1_GONPE|nr:hypothetical protein GPECTOR_16g551 [Gonium pectorale]|eukprot:KXZ50378.1 hypothetical protein GPECTOR_16g551 [Gonium pectorale]